MTIITEENFPSAYASWAEKFWSEVDWLVTSILDGDRGMVRQYERDVRDGPIGEQILTYHDAPLNVALDLVGQRELTASQRDMLTRIGGEKWRSLAGELGRQAEEAGTTSGKKWS